MKIIFTRIGLLFFVFALFFACKTEKQNNDAPNDIVYDTISVSEVYHIENDTLKPSCTLDIEYIYPVKYGKEEVLKTVQGELNFVLMEDEKYEKLSPAEAVNKYVEDYIANYKREVEEQYPEWKKSGEAGDYFSYQKTLASEVIFSKAEILSYQIVSTDDKGGANSSKFSRNVVFDLETGNVIQEKDIFLSGYKDFLNAVVVSKIMVQNKVTDVEDLVAYGYIGVEDLTSNNNFYVDDKGITYIFNPGDYSIFTLDIKVFLPYAEIKQILKEDSPISKFAGL